MALAGDEQAGSPDRRRVLRWLAGLSALGSAALAGLPPLRALLSPVFRRPEPQRWFKVGDASSFDIGTPARIDFSEVVADAWVEHRAPRTVWVYTADGTHFTAYNGRCTHLGCAFRFDSEPDPHYHHQPNVFHCPCHHGIFDPKTGAVIAGPPPRPLDTLETKIDAGALFVAYESFRVGIPNKVAV